MGTNWTVDANTGKVTTPKIMLSPEGGIAILLANNTGVLIPKGTVLQSSGANDESVAPIGIDDVYPIGIAYEDIGIGASGWVVVAGRCQVLVNATAVPARNNWLGVSDTTAGRARVVVGDPGATVLHSREVGHTLGSKDVNNLVWAMVHFN